MENEMNETMFKMRNYLKALVMIIISSKFSFQEKYHLCYVSLGQLIFLNKMIKW